MTKRKKCDVLIKCSPDTVLFVCLCHNRSENQAVGMENQERKRIRDFQNILSTCSHSGISAKSASADNSVNYSKYVFIIICLGQELPEFTPVEIVGYEVAEAGSPLALDNG